MAEDEDILRAHKVDKEEAEYAIRAAMVAEEGDIIRPSRVEGLRMLSRSHRIWSSYLEEANREKELQPCFVQLRNILGRVPAYLGNDLKQKECAIRLKLDWTGVEGSELFVSGQSTWRVAQGDCDLEDKVISLQLVLGACKSTVCHFADDARFANWSGLQHEKRTVSGGNHFAILAFAWAYILSARWLEMQPPPGDSDGQENGRMFYLDAKANQTSEGAAKSSEEIEVNLGDVDDNAARWWGAILATGEGWRAEITRKGTSFRSPWSICFAATQSFKIRSAESNQNILQSTHVPPSSEVALRYLSDYVDAHGIDSQCSVGLATALTFPQFRFDDATLPRPVLSSTNDTPNLHSPCVERQKMNETVLEESKLLPYYMTLSCNWLGMRTILNGSFFDSQINCNLVGPWFLPIFDIVGALAKAGDFEKLALVMGKRQPNLAALWMGASISGMAAVIFKDLRRGDAIEPHASPWTSTVHSFINLEYDSLDTVDDGVISRADECRLLYVADPVVHPRLPFPPWRPLGFTSLCDTEIEVRKHVKCAGHQLQYLHWSWNLSDGCTLKDPGFAAGGDHRRNIVATDIEGSSNINVDLSLKEDKLSEHATRSIFLWLRMDGWPKNEQDIRAHSWVSIGDDSDEEIIEDDLMSGDGSLEVASKKEATERWALGQHEIWCSSTAEVRGTE